MGDLADITITCWRREYINGQQSIIYVQLFCLCFCMLILLSSFIQERAGKNTTAQTGGHQPRLEFCRYDSTADMLK